MNFENLINALKEEGIEAEGITVCKNGCECLGIRVIDPENPGISPIVYYSAEDTMESIISRIMAAKDFGIPDINLHAVNDPVYVSRNVYFSIQKTCTSDNDALTKPCLDLELVLRVALTIGDNTGSVKMTRSLLERCSMSEEAVWAMARENMLHRFAVRSMAELLSIPEEFAIDMPLYVCTTDSGTNGASVLAFPEVFRRFCEEHGKERLYILPSSTEEVIICPADAYKDASVLAEMVRDINASCVDPLLQLNPAVYCFDYETDELTIAAESEGE